ncbi:hypothetical protein POF50_021155 [Streptomyces sp. SL13]|uniref:Uncharacterized protein n=1 Tax=Streptantibioticus silvisoli TaxID=2705255 RepID=A0AA90H4H5_9ACTN|nr:hypothetical protein [Streptantibioticus silvisoli]MDI5971811.1 hypothetical protein [Streptantibioticus silvisoli]
MRRTAQALRDQARELRAIATTDGRLEGAYADTLRAGAADLDHHLRQTAERYEHVHAHLTNWANELDDMQSESTVLLRRAQEESSGPAGAPVGTHPDDDPVQPLRRSLNRLTADRDDRAAVYAARIRHACDDVIADSAWEGVEDAVGAVFQENWFNEVLEVASWTATFVGLIALFISPPAWIVGAALVLSFALIAKDVLALAVNQGSWFDISMDAAALLTMGGGKMAVDALVRIQEATKLSAEAAAAERAVAAALHDVRPVLDRTYRITNRRNTPRAAKTAARQLRLRLLAQAERLGEQAGHAESMRPMSNVTLREAFSFGGDTEVAGISKDIEYMRNEYPESSSVQQESRQRGAWQAVGRSSFWVGTGLDGVDKGIGQSQIAPLKPFSHSYMDFKNRFAVTYGTRW